MRARGAGAVLWLPAVACVSFVLAARPAPVPAPAELLRANRALRLELQLAEQGGLYLVIDAANKQVRLKQSAALLREFAVASVETGRPSALFFSRSGGAEPATATSLKRLSPARLIPRTEVIVERDPDAEAADDQPVIPLDPAELFPAPARFFLHFDHRTTLEVRRIDLQSAGWATRSRWKLGDALAALHWHPTRRIRLFMSEPEAGALYRSIAPGTKLIVQ